jgi:hypothetical protein
LATALLDSIPLFKQETVAKQILYFPNKNANCISTVESILKIAIEMSNQSCER